MWDFYFSRGRIVSVQNILFRLSEFVFIENCFHHPPPSPPSNLKRQEHKTEKWIGQANQQKQQQGKTKPSGSNQQKKLNCKKKNEKKKETIKFDLSFNQSHII